MNFNKVFLAGRLTKDPESREVNGSAGLTTVTEYTLAVNDKGKGKKVQYIDCVCWRRTAVFAKDWLSKGRSIFVVGTWETSSYKNKDGYTVKSNKCHVNEHYFTDEKRDAVQASNSETVRDDDFFTKLANEADDFIRIPDDVGDEGLPFN